MTTIIIVAVAVLGYLLLLAVILPPEMAEKLDDLTKRSGKGKRPSGN